ncbi:glycosyltransferase family 9 protein [Jiangella ureilytica]|uniref:Glycosyltransferase family 9 protein n=1 Tax=Jiangella ureilytica TaxID=2530374 RepID=A0A4R4RQH2_9ACTN|nr:glycosyltransferase family 9 protein [Jiangella ureilytica]TDC52137.1 glycosyltransferase family 9 protein [Jiangella ureilytica]
MAVVLVYRAIGLGDFLTGVPALRAVRRALPQHRLVLATSPPLAPLVPLVGGIDEMLPTRALRPLPWAGDPPDVAVNLHGRGPQSHQVLAALRPRRLIAFGNEEARLRGPVWRAAEHEVRRWCRLVAAELRVCAPDHDLVLRRPAAAPQVEGALIVHPGAAAAARRWPAGRFATVARWLAASKAGPVVVTGSAAETELARAVADAAGLPPSAVLAGRTALDELAALVAAARLVVAGDTGIAHLASAYRTPSVVLFGPTSPRAWGPPETGPHIALWHGPAGDPHADVLDPALDRIQVDEVIAAVDTLASLVRV